jgi:hypothetical protein
MLIGGALTAFGLALALDALGLVEAGLVLRYWPALLVGLGIVLLVRARGQGPWFPGVALILVGAAFLLERLGALGGFDAVWPLIVILIGLAIMARGFGTRRSEPAASDDSISSFVVLSSSNPRSSSRSFRGGQVSAFLGACEIDLTQAGLGEKEAVLDVLTLMGGIEVRVPPEWTVDSRVTPFMGGVEDSSNHTTSDPAKRLLIKGFVMMGGLSIKN